MELALMQIHRSVKGKVAVVSAGTCFDPKDGDELDELRGMKACRKATEDEVAIHEGKNRPAKKAAAKKPAAEKPDAAKPAAAKTPGKKPLLG
jgi:hypothetical protein